MLKKNMAIKLYFAHVPIMLSKWFWPKMYSFYFQILMLCLRKDEIVP